nr:helix-turn-helix transcriptional regulator [Intestinimonas butyriciproducens]
MGGGAYSVRENLRKARKAVGLTQQAMADKLGISLRYYQQIEAGDRTGDFTLWDTLEDITGIHQRILRDQENNRL